MRTICIPEAVRNDSLQLCQVIVGLAPDQISAVVIAEPPSDGPKLRLSTN